MRPMNNHRENKKPESKIKLGLEWNFPGTIQDTNLIFNQDKSLSFASEQVLVVIDECV